MERLSITKFLEPFFPDKSEEIHLLAIYPDKKRPQAVKFQVTRDRLAHDERLQALLKNKNKTHGIYFVVNAGGTHIPEINRITALFCEIDEGGFAAQHKLYDECGLPPSIRVETNKSVHAYWLLNEEMPVDLWQRTQQTLIKIFNSDEKIKNPNRLMRLPFFNHVRLSDNNQLIYKKVSVQTFEPHKKYTLAEIEKVFAPVVPAPVKPEYKDGFNSTRWDSVMQELRYRIAQHSTYHVESNRTWATARGVCHNGQGNTALTVNLRSGAVFCQKECSIDAILSAFGLERPQRQTKIEYKERRKQTSTFYQWVKAEQENKKIHVRKNESGKKA